MGMIENMMASASGPKEAPMAAGDDLTACCHDLAVAVHGKDTKAMAEAFRACFACCEAEKHEEPAEKE